MVTVDKRDIFALIEEMPEQIDPEDLIERLYLLRKLEAAEADVREGRLRVLNRNVRTTEKCLSS